MGFPTALSTCALAARSTTPTSASSTCASSGTRWCASFSCRRRARGRRRGRRSDRLQAARKGLPGLPALTTFPGISLSALPSDLPIRAQTRYLPRGGSAMTPTNRCLLSSLCTLVLLQAGCSSPGNPLGLFPEGQRLLPVTKEMRQAAPEPLPLPRELDKQLAPDYIIEPGDVLLVQPADLDSPI